VEIRRTHNIGDSRDGTNHDSYKRALDRLLTDLKAENPKPQDRVASTGLDFRFGFCSPQIGRAYGTILIRAERNKDVDGSILLENQTSSTVGAPYL
jgi:hypothetical protein